MYRDLHGTFGMGPIHIEHSIRTNKIVEALPFADRSALCAVATEAVLSVNTLLYDAGSELEHVYFPNEGLVSLVVVMSGGSFAEAGFVGAEGAFVTVYGALKRKSFTRVAVVASGTALRVPIDDFERIHARSDIFRELIAQNNRRITERAQQIAACNLLHRLEQRLCRWLLQVFDNSETSSAVITQNDLAQMLGVNRAPLNVVLRNLQKSGAIAQPGSRILKIVDANLVAEKVCDCYRLMRA